MPWCCSSCVARIWRSGKSGVCGEWEWRLLEHAGWSADVHCKLGSVGSGKQRQINYESSSYISIISRCNRFETENFVPRSRALFLCRCRCYSGWIVVHSRFEIVPEAILYFLCSKIFAYQLELQRHLFWVDLKQHSAVKIRVSYVHSNSGVRCKPHCFCFPEINIIQKVL